MAQELISEEGANGFDLNMPLLGNDWAGKARCCSIFGYRITQKTVKNVIACTHSVCFTGLICQQKVGFGGFFIALTLLELIAISSPSAVLVKGRLNLGWKVWQRFASDWLQLPIETALPFDMNRSANFASSHKLYLQFERWRLKGHFSKNTR